LIESGSVAIYGIAAAAPDIDDQTMRLETPTVSELGLIIAQRSAGEAAAEYPDVAGVWAEVAEEVGVGRRSRAIIFERISNSHRSRARIDSAGKGRLARIASSAEARPTRARALTGHLFEANFERQTAQLRLATGELVDVEFPPELANDIYSVLRRRPSLVGEVTFDPVAQRALRIRVRKVDTGRQLPLFNVDFWTDTTIHDLRTGSGTPGVTNPETLRVDATDDEWARLFSALGIEA
jgi:hypothetical protein